MKSNGWSTTTAALQLFVHLDGDALHVTLLMPDKIRECWKDLVTGLSEYYNTPGRLAVFRRQFENVCRRPGVDPATFVTELGILAVRGFSDINGKARDLMIRNKFIAAQRSCELRRHLDGAAEEASIGHIVASCRIWESHAEPVFVGSVRQDPDGSLSMLQVTVSDKSLPATSESRWLHQDVGRVIPATRGPPPRVTHSSADRELLIQNVLEAVRARRTTIPQWSQERELEFMLRDTLLVASVTEERTSPPVLQPVGGAIPLTNDQWKRGPCFSCGLHGHGVNRCSRMDVSFPYLLPGWSVDVRNGQYRASRMHGDGRDCQPGKEGWFGWESQPPGPSMIVTHLTQVGGSELLGDALRLGDNRRVAPIELDGPRMPRAFQLWGASLLLKKNDVIVRFQIAAIGWWHEIRRWNRPRRRS